LNEQTLTEGALLQEIITAVRDARIKNGLKPKDRIKVWITTQQEDFYQRAQSILLRQIGADEVGFVADAPSKMIGIVVNTDKLYLEAETAVVDTTAQKAALDKDIAYLQGFLASVEKKLGNERFMQSAKQEVIDIELKKKSDALAKIKALEESLSLL